MSEERCEMKKIVILFFILILGVGGSLFFFLQNPTDSKKVLRVMTYSSFAGVFGPGIYLQKEFEKTCDCQIKWIKVPDSTLFVQRLSLKKDGFKTDVVLGLDQLSLKSARTLVWKKIKVKPELFNFPARDFLSNEFIPYDWSPMTFLSRKKSEVFLSLQDLLHEKYKNNISLPSSRTSTVGFQFYYWIWFIFQENVEHFLKSLKNQLYGMSPSWSTSYALFQRGHVSLSFSYLSSLLYHQEQKQEDFYPMQFKEAHPFQVELVGVSGFCTQCELAKSFVHFLLKPEIQNHLIQKNYMLPVISTVPETPFIQTLPKLKLIRYDKWDLFLEKRDQWLNKWDLLLKTN